MHLARFHPTLGNLSGSTPRHGTSAAAIGLNPPLRSTVCYVLLRAIVRAIVRAGLALCSMSAAGQNLADQPLRIVTAYAPGLGFDLILHRIAPALSTLLLQAVQ